ncbi:MAG: CBS domain-containing protein [Candidatus Krumholzibacteria bacterium]|nr:CBS domain-containing protein [Candidatus Krumholzibacteria bacterium]
MKIGDYMQRDFRKVSPHTPLPGIARAFYETGQPALPVVRADGSLAGIIAIEDFILVFLPQYIDLVRSVDFIRDFGFLERTSYTIEERLLVAEDLMREEVFVLEETESVMKAAAALHKHRLQRIPVVGGGKLTGMISLNDVCRAIYDMEGRS